MDINHKDLRANPTQVGEIYMHQNPLCHAPRSENDISYIQVTWHQFSALKPNLP